MSNEWLIGKNEVNFCYKLYSKINRYDKIIKILFKFVCLCCFVCIFFISIELIWYYNIFLVFYVCL